MWRGVPGPLPVWLLQKLIQSGAITAQRIIGHHEEIPRKSEGQQAGPGMEEETSQRGP